MRTAVVSVFVVAAMMCARVRAECIDAGTDTLPPHPSALALELVHEADHARTWRYVWTGINGGLTLLPLGGLVVLPKKERGDLIVSASVSAISTAFTWFWPLDVEDDAARAMRLRSSEPGECDPELRALFEHSREDEASRYAWPWHVGNFVSALIPAAIILFAFHDRTNAALAVAGGFALGEVELLTQPMGLVDQRPPRGVFAVSSLGRSWIVSYRLRW